MAGDASRLNGRKGGRPVGSKTASTLEKEAVRAAFNQKVMQSADVLYRSQMALAVGQTYLYKINLPDKKPILVVDPDEIEYYLRGDHEDTGERTYYFITTKDPDGRAIDSLLDRALDKAKSTTELTGKDGSPLFDNDKGKQAISGFIDNGDN